MRWGLPDFIQDVLPDEAVRLEELRRRLLDAFRAHGYRLVIPPLIEYLDSLTTGAGEDLRLCTYQLIDQLSGRTMGVRADMTPQVTRIDSHLLNHTGVSRLCYCGSVLRTRPSSLTATREPLQLGAELYGHAGLEADIEVLRLLAEALRLAGIPLIRIDIGHVGLFRALADSAGLNEALCEEAFTLLQGKDIPGLRALLADVKDCSVRKAILALPELYGGKEILDAAEARLPRMPQVAVALDELRQLAVKLTDLPLSFDLADLRGYHYHSGLVFAAYGSGAAAALAMGGRYDRVARNFGRDRAATGFSLDLRELTRHSLTAVSGLTSAILAPLEEDPTLQDEITALRKAGEVVIGALPGHEGTWKAAGCNRQLVKRDGQWMVTTLH
ncbi:MAG: ATP phosphoribosyltransferase regulatory subunit [Azoarcus sp.]|jgi:ATP phosphoribosyltransferase regulatory subunit|nr:ATP phosphoribosyltransferase regulatory subunit [Azoarcus sp.]